MMPKEFIDLIRSTGYTRVVIRPNEIPETLTVMEANELVEKSSVSLRGWDYPHITTRNDDHGGKETFADFVQHWCNWNNHREFWRMYKSGQFLHYKSLREDLNQGEKDFANPVLAIGSLIYTVTEVVEFMYRLSRHGLYKSGAEVELTIGGTKGRQLWVDDPRRMPFSAPRVTSSPSIIVERTILPEQLETGEPKDPALSMLMEIFDAFGWKPSSDQINRNQDDLYALRLGRG